MVITGKRPKYQDIDGFKISVVCDADAFRKALKYSPKPRDVFVATYPKCGTTWMQQLIYLIYHEGKPSPSHVDFQLSMPFLELFGIESVEKMKRPGAIKTHLPYHMTPQSEKAKYIYVARNPRDCCVSFYHHTALFPGYFFDGTFDDIFEMFVRGELDFGDYFDNLLSWYAHRDDPNVLFLTYEAMKADLTTTVMRVARFLGKNYADAIEKDPQLLQNILKYSRVDYMKEAIGKPFMKMLSEPPESILQDPDLPKWLKGMVRAVKDLDLGKVDEGKNFVRKGIVGDWKNYFSEEQLKRLDARISEKTKGSDVMSLWKDLGY